jgi:hypothetical protein
MSTARLSTKRAAIEEEEAQDYAWAIQNAGMIRPDWHAKNADIIDRLSMAALLRIKKRAWQIIEEPR